jgi:hypothetical protein
MVCVRPHGLAQIMASRESRQVGKGVPNDAPGLAKFEDCGKAGTEGGTPGGGRTRTTYTPSRVVRAFGVDSSGVIRIRMQAALSG